MSVAVSCNLPDGVILGVDSAVTLPAPAGGVAKVFENAEKLFQLGERPIGIATFGLASFATRSIGSYLREFEVKEKVTNDNPPNEVSEVVEKLRAFFMEIYRQTIIPTLEQAMGRKYQEIPLEQRPGLGLAIGGFSMNSPLSEVWTMFIPNCETPNSAERVREPGNFGTNWFATFEPIRRYLLGFDPRLLTELVAYFGQLREASLTPDEERGLNEIIARYAYQIPYHAMPMEEGVNHTRFLVDLVINHHRYAYGAPVVGGRSKIGKVSYKGEQFQILDA